MRNQRILSFLLALTMVSSLSAIASSADTVEQDGLSVSYSTDKDKYSKTDTIKATLKVTNKNSDTVRDLVLDETIPDGYVLADGYYKNKTVSELKSNEVVELDTLFVPKETDNNDDSSNTTSGSSNDSSSSGASNNNSDLSNEPPTTNNVVSNLATNNSATKTPDVVAPQPTPTPNPTPGPDTSSYVAPSPVPDPTPSPTPDSTPDYVPEPDSSSIVEKDMQGKPGGGDRAWAYAVAVLAVSLTVITAGKNGKHDKKKMLSIVVAGTMLISYMPVSDIKTSANESHKIDITKSVYVNSNELVLHSSVTYGTISSNPNPYDNKKVTFDLDNSFIYDNNSDTYLLFNEKKEIKGTVSDESEIEKATYSVTDCNGTVLKNGELTIDDGWIINDLAFVVGENDLSVDFEYKNGQTKKSSIKVQNLSEENQNTLDLDKNDDDNDGVLNYIEIMYHTDPQNPDTDGDGLSDYDEMAIFGTDPNNTNTNDSEISDADLDSDEDGISNFDEIYTYKTNPITIDSDGDGLSDYDEVITYKTKPDVIDTDGDGADDNWEIQTGFDPLVANSDFGDFNPTGKLNICSDDDVIVTAVVDDVFLNDTFPGFMGVTPYYINLGERVTSTLTIPYDNTNSSEEDQPTVYRFNEETQVLEEIPTTINDDGTVSTNVTSSGTYVLLNKRYIEDVWNQDISHGATSKIQGNIDIVFVVDRSYSMDWNDPKRLRIEAVKEFINRIKLRNNSGDRVAIVQYTALAQTISPLSDDYDNAIAAVESIVNSNGVDSYAGTNGAVGIRNALDELANSDAPNKYVIFLTDGSDTNTPSDYGFNYTYTDLEKESVDSRIIIHTVGLIGTNRNINEDLLKDIAKKTGGNYYLATAKEDGSSSGSQSDIPEIRPISDVYDEIASETLDDVDSNNDGITDKITKLMCEGKIRDISGRMVFANVSYEEIQNGGSDFDGDGLTNGEEVELAENGNYFIVHSYPYKPYSDKDLMNDYEETKIYKTNPMRYNTNVRKDTVNLLTDDECYQSSYFRNLLNESSLTGAWIRGSVFIGNAFYGTTLNQEVFYETVLVDYFNDLNKEIYKQKEEYKKDAYSAFTEAAFRDDFEKCLKAAERDETETRECIQGLVGKINEFCDVAGIGKNAVESMEGYNELYNIINGNQAELKYITNILTKVESNIKNLPLTIDDSTALSNYAKALNNIYGDYSSAAKTVVVRMNSTCFARFGRSIETVDNGLRKAAPILDKASKVGDVFTELSLIINSGNSIENVCEEYQNYISNLGIMQEDIYILDAILANTNNSNLSAAALKMRIRVQLDMENMRSAVETNMKWDSFGNLFLSIGADGLHAICQKIPLTIPFEIVRTIGNIANVGDKAEMITKSSAAAEIARILSDHYINGLKDNASDGGGMRDRWVAYDDYCADLYTYLLNLAIIRRNSEKYVIEKYETNNEKLGLSDEAIFGCKTMIDSCNGVLTEYFPKLLAFNRINASNQ